MSRAVLMSIRPEWCALIINGRKTVEVRKSRPRMEPPFKVYIYCTKGKPNDPNERLELHSWDKDNEVHITHLNGKVVGEFTCNSIDEIWPRHVLPDVLKEIAMDICDLLEYSFGGSIVQGWHITNLKMYSKPKELSEFTGLRGTKFGFEPTAAVAPQSWCYVEELS